MEKPRAKKKLPSKKSPPVDAVVITHPRYVEGVGKRKTAVARVRIVPNKEALFIVNGRPIDKYFPDRFLVSRAYEPLKSVKRSGEFNVSVKVSGGGVQSQADAVRHGLARAIVKMDLELRKPMKKLGYLRRDPRMKERKKPGLKRARRAPQWAKR